MTWSVRTADSSDVARIASFAGSLFRHAYGPTHPEPTLSEYLATAFAEARFAESIADPACTTLVVESLDGAWLGYAQLRMGAPTPPTRQLLSTLPGTKPVEIVRFYVDHAWHGRGVAGPLMHACEENARERGCDVLWLQAWQEAQQALRFYEKAGFSVYGTAVFTFGERADSDLVLARAIAPGDYRHRSPANCAPAGTHSR